MTTNIQHAYADWAATYDTDRNLTRDLDEQVMRTLFADLRFDSVVEIGCGTGKNTGLLAGIAQRVQAIDFSPSMIDQARQKSDVDNVTFTVADITQPWPCEDQSANLVTCNLVLEHVKALSPIFAEAARVLINGGQLFVCELHPFRQYLGVQACFTRCEVTQTIEAFVHNITDFTDAASETNLSLESIKEWRHEEDEGKPPRLISFLFART